jgi:hypothetical protein
VAVGCSPGGLSRRAASRLEKEEVIFGTWELSEPNADSDQRWSRTQPIDQIDLLNAVMVATDFVERNQVFRMIVLDFPYGIEFSF